MSGSADLVEVARCFVDSASILSRTRRTPGLATLRKTGFLFRHSRVPSITPEMARRCSLRCLRGAHDLRNAGLSCNERSGYPYPNQVGDAFEKPAPATGLTSM